MPKIEISVDIGGRGTVKVDGVDLSGVVSGFNLRVRSGRLTTLTMQMVADVDFRGAGEVRTIKTGA